MRDSAYYKERYTTSEARVLYLTAIKGYGSIGALADDLGVSRTYLPECFLKGLPAKYSGYLGRKFSLPPALLNYGRYLMVTEENQIISYEDTVYRTDFFNHEDRQYILEGEHIKDSFRWLKTQDAKIGL